MDRGKARAGGMGVVVCGRDWVNKVNSVMCYKRYDLNCLSISKVHFQSTISRTHLHVAV